MNILVLSHLYPRPDDPSCGIFVHRQVKQLQRLGHQVTVVSIVPWSPWILHLNPKWRFYGQIPHNTLWEGVEVYYVRYLRFPGAWFRALSSYVAYRPVLSLVLRLHRNKPFDVIHSNTLLPDGLMGVHLGQKLRISTVCTVHGSDIFINPFENAINLHFSKIVIRRTHQVIAVSQLLKDAAEHLAEPLRDISIIYNGVNISEFHKAPLTNRYDRPYILFVGRNIFIKGLKDLLIAFSQLKDRINHKLIVVGPTLNEVKEIDPDLVQPIIDRLIVTGPLLPEEIPEYMKNCDLFVLPSHSEGLGIAILEAMAAKRAVVATQVGGIPEIVLDNVTGLLVPPGEPSLLAKCIQSLITDPQRCWQMGQQGYKRVSEKFTWDRNAQQMSLIYKTLIETKTCPRRI